MDCGCYCRCGSCARAMCSTLSLYRGPADTKHRSTTTFTCVPVPTSAAIMASRGTMLPTWTMPAAIRAQAHCFSCFSIVPLSGRAQCLRYEIKTEILAN